MRNVFVDWGATKPHYVLVDDVTLPQVMTSDELIKFGVPFNVYLEAGCPHKFLYELITKGCEIYSCDTHELSLLRGDEIKTDENDVVLIRELWREKPKSFQKMSLPQCKDIQLKFIMGKYLRFMREVARFKKRQMSYEKEFGQSEAYSVVLASLEEQKKLALKMLKPLLSDELSKVDDIKGVGIRFLAGLLATAHPKRFPTLSKYLSYCGYKETSWRQGKGKFNREAKSVAWQMSKSIILHRDPHFYPLYIKIKNDLKNKNPEYAKSKINGMTINRTSTFLLKEIYSRYS